MARFDGSAALKLDFGGVTTTTPVLRAGRGGLRLALRDRRMARIDGRSPDKYTVLEHRRRQAQIKARRLLDIMEEA